MYWAIALLALGLIILVHELGHFIVARRKGIPISTFSVGFGPRLFGIKKGETDFRISAIPLGGYVLPKLSRIDELHRIPVNRRIAFSLGGPIANILFAIVLLSIYNAITGGINLTNILILPFIQCGSFMISMFLSLGALFTDPGNISGIVGIASQGGSMISGGFVNILVFMIFISLNLAIINLLPIPILDGGKVFMALMEKISVKSRRTQVPLTFASLFILLGIILFSTLNDIIGLLGV